MSRTGLRLISSVVAVSATIGTGNPVGVVPPSAATASPSEAIATQLTRSCQPIISSASGIQRGKASQSLLVIGNPNCIEAQYGGQLRVEVSLCGGRITQLSGIQLQRNGFANGRRWSSNPPITYEIIYSDGTRSIPQPLGRGFYGRDVSFPPQPATGVAIMVPSRLTRGYEIYEQLCSVSFTMSEQSRR